MTRRRFLQSHTIRWASVRWLEEVSRLNNDHELDRYGMSGMRLLRDADERRLAMDLENVRHLQMLETMLETGAAVDLPDLPDTVDPSSSRKPWRLAALLLARVAEADAIAQSIGRCQGVESRMSLRYVKQSGILDDLSAVGVDDFVVDRVAGEWWISLNEAHDRIVQLSCDIRLLPPGVVAVVHAYVPFADREPWAGLARRLSDPGLRNRLMLADFGAAAHFERIRRRGRFVEARLVKMNRFLVDRVADELLSRPFGRGRLVRESHVALLQSAADYDPRDGIEFGEYAARRMHYLVAQTVSADETIRAAIDSVSILRHRRSLFRELRRKPTVEELAASTGIPANRIAEVQELRGNRGASDDALKPSQEMSAVSLHWETQC